MHKVNKNQSVFFAAVKVCAQVSFEALYGHLSAILLVKDIVTNQPALAYAEHNDRNNDGMSTQDVAMRVGLGSSVLGISELRTHNRVT